MTYKKTRKFPLLLAFGLSALLFTESVLTAKAEPIDYNARAEQNRLLQVESNEIDGWPQGPAVSAKAAILMEANTGAILYAKNIHEQLYPASTTKILTALIAMEESDMNETVTYSDKAVGSINWMEDSNIGIKAGESISMEQSLYGLLVGSGNECGNAIGEHISGSMEAFAEKMNQRAAQLGCTDSHFVTTNGIHDDQHYTSVHDLALIAREFFSWDLLCRMSSTLDYVIPASDTLSKELIPFTKNRLLPGRNYGYEGLVGSKTGYTSLARQNLVSCAQKNGMKLICVVMQDEAPYQYTDTIDLFNYGFSNFRAVNIADNDATYTVKTSGFFRTGEDIFGNSSPMLFLDPDAYLVLPTNAVYEDTLSGLDYDNLEEGQAALVRYSYSGQPVGSAPILLSPSGVSFDFNKEVTPEEASLSQAIPSLPQSGQEKTEQHVIFLNVRSVLFWLVLAAALIILFLLARAGVRNYRQSKRHRAILKRHRERKKNGIDLDKYTSL